MCTLTAYPAVRISLTKTGPRTLTLTWTGSPGVVYRAQSSTNATGPWKKYSSPVLGNGQRISVPVSILSGSEYFRLIESDKGASIDFTDGQSLSGTVRIDITALVSSGEIQSIGLWDIFGQTTNVLDYIDIREPSRRSFIINTAHLRNGMHQLQLELISGTSIWYSDTVSVRCTNAITVVSKTPTEFMRYLEFVPRATNGIYSVIVKNDQGISVQSTNRTISGSLTTNGTIVFKDGSARFTNVYTSTYFDYELSTVVERITNTYSFRSYTVPVNDWIEGTVISQVPTDLDIESSELDAMLLEPLSTYGLFGDVFMFDTGARESTALRWNILDSGTYLICNDYLLGSYGRAPSHIHFHGYGGTDYLGYRSVNNMEGVSTATLAALSISNRPTFIFLDGYSAPRSLVTLLSGITEIGARWSRQDLLREGRRPHVVCYWSNTPFPYQDTDISVQHRQFITDLYTELWKPDFTGLPAQTIDVALARMRQRYPAVMNEFVVAGSYVGMFIDEIITHQ